MRARRPRPETEVLPQCARLLDDQYASLRYDGEGERTIFVFRRGDNVRVCPVHARRAFR